MKGTLLRIFVVLCVIWGALGVSSAFGAETHQFDPTLSLTGGCATSLTDPVWDPGCPEGEHPSASFVTPRAVTTDSYGNIYVASYGNVSAGGAQGRIDIFDPEGFFITEVPDSAGPLTIAVDGDGNLYVFESGPGFSQLRRFPPSVYSPETGNISYGETPVLITDEVPTSLAGIAVDPTNDHLLVNYAQHVTEYSSAATKNELLDDSIGSEVMSANVGVSIAIDAAHGRIYVSDRDPVTSEGIIRSFDRDSPHSLLQTIDSSTTPIAEFFTQVTVAADEGTGNFFIYDGGDQGSNVVYEFGLDGTYLSTIKYGIKKQGAVQIAVDNGSDSPNGVLNPFGRYLFVPSPPGNSLAYGPPEEAPPEIEATSFTEVTESEAELRAVINPWGDETSYYVEYTTGENFEDKSFADALVTDGAELPSGTTGIEVSIPLHGLSPETAYRYRVVADNSLGSDQSDGQFTTFAASAPIPTCPNDPVRTALSALLPDCRAYELVTPADTNARAPTAIGHLGAFFATRPASPAGDAVSFLTEGGTLPGSDGTGSWGGDRYLASRSQDGWISAPAGPTGSESPAPVPGGNSPDQGYFLWETSGEGSAVIDGQVTSYVRYPDGHSELVGRGSLGADPRATGKLISEDGGHIIFVSGSRVGASAVQLEPDAPPDGTKAIYDRTADEVTHVVSLLPGDLTPAAGQSASYVGASLDGEGVAFTIGSTLYLRHDNEETYEAAKEATFAGVAEGGGRIFYVKSGDLFAFDVASEEAVPFTESGDVTVVNVASLGTAAYFTSPTVLTEEENPNGATPQAGKENLYLSEEGAISFVSSVTERDVVGEPGEKELIPALGNWLRAVGPGTAELPGRFAFASSRATPDGTALLFESRADLDGYDPEGHVEIYRYDAVDGALECLSCNPTQAPATGEASLQSIRSVSTAPEPLSPFALVGNLRADGRRAFFQSEEALVAHDTDGLQDIYEWEAEGVGTCIKPGGCTYLISSGHSDRVDYLFAVSDSGDDVFIRSSDLLLGSDADETPSIYDARVVGGFPENSAQVCQGEGCKPDLWLPPPLPTPGMLPGGGSGKAPSRPCPKGKRKVKQAGKVRCVRKHRNHRRHKAGSQRRGTRK